jgi:hypothetical protein
MTDWLANSGKPISRSFCAFAVVFLSCLGHRSNHITGEDIAKDNENISFFDELPEPSGFGRILSPANGPL